MKEKINAAKTKIERAKRRLQAAQDEYDVMEMALDDAQCEIDKAETEVMAAEREYRRVLQAFYHEKIKKPSTPFEKRFYLASRFCRDDGRKNLDHVSVHSDRLIACDGVAAVILRCDGIPTHLMGKLVPWDVLDLSNPSTSPSEEFPDVKKLITDHKFQLMLSKVISKDGLLEEINNSEALDYRDKPVVLLSLDDTIIALNQNYLNNIMDCFDEGDEIVIRWKGELSSIIFESEETTALLCPIRLVREEF